MFFVKNEGKQIVLMKNSMNMYSICMCFYVIMISFRLLFLMDEGVFFEIFLLKNDI